MDLLLNKVKQSQFLELILLIGTGIILDLNIHYLMVPVSDKINFNISVGYVAALLSFTTALYLEYLIMCECESVWAHRE